MFNVDLTPKRSGEIWSVGRQGALLHILTASSQNLTLALDSQTALAQRLCRIAVTGNTLLERFLSHDRARPKKAAILSRSESCGARTTAQFGTQARFRHTVLIESGHDNSIWFTKHSGKDIRNGKQEDFGDWWSGLHR
jgi:hypothetical protein